MDDREEVKTKGNSNSIIIAVIVIVLLVGAYFLFKGNKSETTTQQKQTAPATAMVAKTSPASTSQAKTFNVEAGNYYFSLKEIKVKVGDKVKIHLVNKGGFHDWVIDEFNAKTPRINDNETADIEFTADKAGTFEYYCSVGKHRQMGMKGNLIVEE